jgi:hypothetical protein
VQGTIPSGPQGAEDEADPYPTGNTELADTVRTDVGERDAVNDTLEGNSEYFNRKTAPVEDIDLKQID